MVVVQTAAEGAPDRQFWREASVTDRILFESRA
jgi:hypothetical protein